MSIIGEKFEDKDCKGANKLYEKGKALKSLLLLLLNKGIFG